MRSFTQSLFRNIRSIRLLQPKPADFLLNRNHTVNELVVDSLQNLHILKNRVGQVRLINRLARHDLVLHANNAARYADDRAVRRYAL